MLAMGLKIKDLEQFRNSNKSQGMDLFPDYDI